MVSPVVKGKFVKTSKSLKMLSKWLSKKFAFAFYALLTIPTDKTIIFMLEFTLSF